MTYEGADVDRLRAAAAQFQTLASSLEAAAKNVNSTLNAPWWGSDADRFRSQWNTVSRPSMTAAVAALHDGASSLRRNALEQEQVSSSAGGTDAVAPMNTAQLLQHIHNENTVGDGVRIEKVLGSDGNTRMIVYFEGQDSTANRSFARNAPLVDGNVDPETIARIREALQGFPDGNNTDIMLVGLSQGGMDAQNIAAHAGQYGLHVTNLVTYGSPVIQPHIDGVQAAHLHASSSEGLPDLIPALGAVAEASDTKPPVLNIIDAVTNLSNQHASPTNSVFEARSDVSSLTAGIDHSKFYPSVAQNFDNSTDPRFTDVKKSMEKFQGTIVDIIPSGNP